MTIYVERFGGHSLSRRSLLRGAAALGAASALPQPAFAQDATTITWWDVFQPLIPLHEKMWAEYAANHSGKVEYTGMNPSDMMQALQLANRSNQMPDVFNVPNSTPDLVNSLASAGWFAPLADSFVFDKPFQQEVLAEGFTTFGGKLSHERNSSLRWAKRSYGAAARNGRGRARTSRRADGPGCRSRLPCDGALGRGLGHELDRPR